MKRASLVLVVAAFVGHAAISAPKVTTTGGTLVGDQSNAVNLFKRVPYAHPPIDALRWAPPQPIKWSGERAATSFALPCLQPMRPDGKPNGAGVTGESREDCLYLNVWAPANAKSAPVMLWLYGGGGSMGSGHVGT